MSAAAVLARYKEKRCERGVSLEELEQRLTLGAGWIDAFESGAVVPTLDVFLAMVHALGVGIDEVTANIAPARTLARRLSATQDGEDLLLHFDYTDHRATYRLPNATLAAFDAVLQQLRADLAPAATARVKKVARAIKADAVAKAFLSAVNRWPRANPSDLWWFLVYRAYIDPFNHPASESHRDFGQSWKRTAGWALERVLVLHYAPWLAERNVRLCIPVGAEKRALMAQLDVPGPLEVDKADVLLTTKVRREERCFGVVHVKASFAERRTDDVPMSAALVGAGYTSPLWTMDCKSAPSETPYNHGELGAVLTGDRDQGSAKRKDIEVEGYFSACFSYNQNTRATPDGQLARARIHVCDFQDPNDAFGWFILAQRRRFETR